VSLCLVSVEQVSALYSLMTQDLSSEKPAWWPFVRDSVDAGCAYTFRRCSCVLAYLSGDWILWGCCFAIRCYLWKSLFTTNGRNDK